MKRPSAAHPEPGTKRLLAALERPSADWVVLCVVLVVVTFFGTTDILLSAGLDPARRRVLVVSNLLAHVTYAVFAPVIPYLLARHPFRRGTVLRSLGWHLVAALAFGGVAMIVMQMGLHLTVRPLASVEAVLLRTGRTVRFNLHDIFFVYMLLAGTAAALHLFRKERRRDLSAVLLERELATAKLEALRVQINPHFVFNTLNAILPLLRKRPEAACDAVLKLGTLLRLSFRSAPSGLVPMREEEEFLRCFLGLEEMRVSDRLSVLVDFSPDVLDGAVPALVLKPFVETALKAGVFRRPGPALLEVTARRSFDDVVVRIHSSARGGSGTEAPPAEAPEIEGACERLERTFGTRQSVRVQWNGPGDLDATLRFPLVPLPPRTAPANEPAPGPVGPPPTPEPSRGLWLPDHPARVTAYAAAFWLASGLYFGSQAHLRAGLQPRSDATVLSYYLPPLARSTIWALLTPGILLLYRRLPLSRRPLLSVPAHVLAAAVAATLVVGIEQSLAAAPSQAPRFAVELPGKAGTYVLFVSILLVLDVARQTRAAELRSARLEAQLAEARLATLRTQLHPHFLFNTLNTLLPLITLDPEAAARVLVQLGDLLRASFRHEPSQLVALADEVEFLKRYLEIEATRFRDRLTVRFDVSGPALGAAVPSLLLQPLVENAVKHGVSRCPGPGTLSVEARRDGDSLVVEVRNDTPLLPESTPAPASHGVGLSNTRARIAQLYGAAGSLEAGPERADRYRVVLRIPWAAPPSFTVPSRIAPSPVAGEAGRNPGGVATYLRREIFQVTKAGGTAVDRSRHETANPHRGR